VSSVAYTTRRFAFAAGHHYRVGAWSDDENARRFGRLAVPHGHNYALDVTIRGPIDETTGMVVDLGDLKRIVTEAIVDRFDHADLNQDPLFRDKIPTTEHIAIAIWDLLAAKLGRERLWQVRVWEDQTLYAEYRGA
jgi:6-pyruvoyltetrahydropterin/6-carboxytetrahydropterin synthase